MHEMSLMGEIVRLVCEDAQLRKFQKIDRIEVIVGDFSNVLPDALEMAFTYFQKQGLALLHEDTVFIIKREVARAKCLNCLIEFEPDYRIALCPKCNLHKSILLYGETFRVESYEGSEDGEG